jgi:hypothetical protein
MELYVLQGGDKEIEGVITIDSHILPVLLEELGPVYLESLGGEPVTADDVLWRVQYDTNWGFFERGREREDRKEALVELVESLEERVRQVSWRQGWSLFQRMVELADQKHILAYMKDDVTQNILTKYNWDGRVNQDAEHFFQLVDANLGGLKTDFFMERSIDMNIQECPEGLCIEARIKYVNTAQEESILNSTYRSYSRVILPQEAFVTEVVGVDRASRIDYTVEHNRKVAGFQLSVPVNQTREVILRYHQPYNAQDASFMIAKQPGILEFDLIVETSSQKLQQSVNRDTTVRL